MKKQKDLNFFETQSLIETLKNAFSMEKFKQLDQLISETIEDNLNKQLKVLDFEGQLDTTFEYLWKIKRFIVAFYELCQQNNDTKFYSTKTFIAYVRLILFADLEENEEIHFIDNLDKFLSYANDKNLLINFRVVNDIINATRVKRYKFHEKVEKLLEKYTTDYDLSLYKEYITSGKVMDNVTFHNFLNELNKLKIKSKIIPYDICKYLMCQMLEPSSTISLEYEELRGLKMGVVCDYISNIQEMKYNTKDYLNYVSDLEKENIYGRYSKSKKVICLDRTTLIHFSRDNVRILITLFHELRHFDQSYFMEKEDYQHGRYRILKEDIVFDKNSGFKKKNLLISYKEIDARKFGILDAINFFEEAGIEIESLKVFGDTPLIDFKKSVIEDCEKSLCDNYQKLNIQRRLIRILKKDHEILKANPILLYEFNSDGSRKKVENAIVDLEIDFSLKQINEDTLVNILNYSIFSEEYITKSKTTANIVKKHKFYINAFKEICLKTLYKKLQTSLSQIKFYSDKELAIKVKQCLEEQQQSIDK